MYGLLLIVFAVFVWWCFNLWYLKKHKRKHKREVPHVPGEIPDWLGKESPDED